jgi:hypothetical protein
VMLVKEDWIYDLYMKEFIKPKHLPTDFYYSKDGIMVMAEDYHKRRGSCCGNGCLKRCYRYQIIKSQRNLTFFIINLSFQKINNRIFIYTNGKTKVYKYRFPF